MYYGVWQFRGALLLLLLLLVLGGGDDGAVNNLRLRLVPICPWHGSTQPLDDFGTFTNTLVNSPANP